jgi:thymidylate synthase
MINKFKNASEAYDYYFDAIIEFGEEFSGTKALFNVGFTLENPRENSIANRERNWNIVYAEAEWQWYLTGDPAISRLGDIYGKVPPIWTRMANSSGEVNSNYGYQWQRAWQLDNVIHMLKENPGTRQACISIYDGKEMYKYRDDTPCTYAVQFTMRDGRLDMCVTMRSNDLWYGFCNDQYCFSSLQIMVAYELGVDVGEYFHFAHNLHLYNDKIK